MSPQLSLPAHLTNASTLVRMLDVGAVLKPASELLGQVNGLCGCGLVCVCVCVCVCGLVCVCGWVWVWASVHLWVGVCVGLCVCVCVGGCGCGWPGYPLVYSV